MIKMLYNSCTGIYKFGNNTYPWRIRRRSNLGNIFRKKKCAFGSRNTVLHVMTGFMTVGVNLPIKEKFDISVTEFFPSASS
jgi:hypothetical protein